VRHAAAVRDPGGALQMKGMFTIVGALTVAALSAAAFSAQGTVAAPEGLKQDLAKRYELLPLRDGIALRPKAPIRGVRLIEVAGETIAVDGLVVTGPELRSKLGTDADLVIRLSYLSADARRDLASGSASQSVPASPPPAIAAPRDSSPVEQFEQPEGR